MSDWFVPKSTRAKNRLKEHGEIVLVRLGIFAGKKAVFTKCKEHCDWRGWFTPEEADWSIPRKNEQEL